MIKELLTRQERRSIQREMKKVIEKAMPDPILREKVLDIYRQNPLLNELMDGYVSKDTKQTRLS